MGMVKIFRPDGWNFDEPVMAPIKISSDGLIGEDRRAFVKRAGDASAIFLPYLDKIKIAADEEPVHLIALGAAEAYSQNRNGDYFSKKACEDHHPTFVKFARPYRNHRNKAANGDPYFGAVKASAWTPRMQRVELILGLNKTKSAADRNGGQIADKELEKLARDGEYPVSMACRIAHDVCSYCENKASTRADYCTSEKCAAGGCRDNITRLIKVGGDLHHLGVYNPEPVFFDISHVGRGADQTAYGARAEWLRKAAEDTLAGIGGAKLAEELGVAAPLEVILAQSQSLSPALAEHTNAQVKLAHGLDALEQRLKPCKEARRAFTADMQPMLDLSILDIDPPYPEKIAGALGALARRSIILPLREFARMTKRAELVEHAQPALKGAYGRMLADGSLLDRVARNPYAPVPSLASMRQKMAAAQLAAGYSLAQDRVLDRVQLSALRGYEDFEYVFKMCKTAAAVPEIEELVRQYAIYKLAALAEIAGQDDDFLLTATLALHQNES